jgi:sulfoxide reductase heme-binding subunit YedZ
MQNAKKRSSFEKWLKAFVNIISLLPLALLVFAYLRGGLGFNPIETVLQRTGRTAMVLLLLSLTCTPIHNLFKLPSIRRLRKPLGLFAALYATVHFTTFAIWDYGLELRLIWMEIREKPFILLGLAALIILLILAVTSFRSWQRKLGKTWVWLHRLVYIAGALTILHYLLAVKGDLFSLQGDYTLPLLAAGVLILLYLLRLPVIYRPLRQLVGRE